MSLAHANREIYKLLKDGVRVSFQNEDGEETDETLRVIDWNNPANNDYSLASQFWVSGNIHKRRDDLDNQIYKNFRNTAAATEECQADSGAHLKQLLSEDHRFIFTLIQKFGTKRGEKYPKLSDRSDIIVMTDEAHRSQYDTLALNMRNALPKAAFIGFTGTTLMAGEEKTKEVFGDYVSIYNFRQSIEDGATVPLFLENRIPELQLTNENFKEDLEALIEAAELDDEQERKLEREFAREYHLITRDDRLEKVAEDLVAHFMGRSLNIVARKLLQTLKEAKLVLDWRKKLRTRADVFSTVRTVLDDLPRIFTPELYQQKCDSVYQHVYDSYPGEGNSIYESA